jgi:hypothetical protein
MNEEQRKKQLRTELGIVFVNFVLPDLWPKHLLKTFQQIRSFKKFDFSTFCTGDPSISSHQLLWRSETIDRAREIVTIAAILMEDATVKIEARLRLEQKVLSRFN